MAAKLKICAECGQEFTPKGERGKPQKFCSPAHKLAHANRRTTRGKSLIALAQGWRQTRGAGDLGKFLFAEMTSMLDDFNAEDFAAGRARAADYASNVSDFNAINPQWSIRYFDRKPSKGQLETRRAKKQERETTPQPSNEQLLEALKQIEAGHNDARGLARDVLSKLATGE